MKYLKSTGRYFLIYSIVLIYLEMILRAHIDGGFKAGFFFFLCFVPAQAAFFTLFNGFFKDRKNLIFSSLILLAIEVYYIAQLIYYKNFGSLFSGSMTGMGAEAVGNFGWTLKEVIRNNLVGIYLMLLPALIVGIISAFHLVKQEKIAWRARLVVLLLVIPLWVLGVQATRLDGKSLQSAYVVYHDQLSDTDNTADHLGALTTTILELYSARRSGPSGSDALQTAVDMNILQLSESLSVSGMDVLPDALEAPEGQQEEIPEIKPHIYEEIDLLRLAKQTEDEEIKELALFLDSRGATDTNEYTGIFEGYNLIWICAESFWSYSIDEQVTPTLYKMANQGIILNNYYNSFRNTTTNGEYAFDTGLWPDFSREAGDGTDVGSLPQSAKRYMPMGLGNLFRGVDVPAYGFHNYYGSYYRRCLSWPNLGYDCKFHENGLKFTSSWPASDLELMEQSVDDYIDEDRFHTYYMTFSGHGPYSTALNIMCLKNYDHAKENMEAGLRDESYCYLAGQSELDKAMEYLLERLEEAGKLNNTVIVIAGDHYPYNLSMDGAADLMGHKPDTDFEIYKSSCIIYNAGMEENIVSDAYCSNIDILPTILNLFGIEYDSRLMIGRDVFSDGIHKAVIYNKSFITDLVRYNRRTGEAEWSELAEVLTDRMKQDYLDNMNKLLDSEFYASIQILNLNFYQYAWYHSGLMTDEELAEEAQRVKRVDSEAAMYNEYYRRQREEAQQEENPEPIPEEVPEGDPAQLPQPEQNPEQDPEEMSEPGLEQDPQEAPEQAP